MKIYTGGLKAGMIAGDRSRWSGEMQRITKLPLKPMRREWGGRITTTLLALTFLVLAACSGPSTASVGESTTPIFTRMDVADSAPPLTDTPAPAPSRSPGPTPSPSAAPPTATPDPYAELSVDGLVDRSYGGGNLVNEELIEVNGYFTRTLFSYPSDGIRVFGFMNVPQGEDGPYPVVIALHGYIDPAEYTTLDYTTRYADALARNG
jgi:hypothetical protein